MTLVVAGRIADPQARSVELADPEGNNVTQPLGSSGFFVATVTTSAPCSGGDWRSTITALAADGNSVAHTGTISLTKLGEKDSALRGPVRACWIAGFGSYRSSP